jgi:hypothetical protein
MVVPVVIQHSTPQLSSQEVVVLAEGPPQAVLQVQVVLRARLVPVQLNMLGVQEAMEEITPQGMRGVEEVVQAQLQSVLMEVPLVLLQVVQVEQLLQAVAMVEPAVLQQQPERLGLRQAEAAVVVEMTLPVLQEPRVRWSSPSRQPLLQQ